MMNNFEIQSTEELIKIINSLPNNYIYRGQANAEWGLTSSLERILGDTWHAKKVKQFEFIYSLL